MTLFFLVGQSVGTAFVIPCFFLCAAIYVGICLCFRMFRTLEGIKKISLSLLLSNLVCEIAWYNLYFEHGEYVNPGIAGWYCLLLWPLILTLSGSAWRLMNLRQQNEFACKD